MPLYNRFHEATLTAHQRPHLTFSEYETRYLTGAKFTNFAPKPTLGLKRGFLVQKSGA
jgi:hypothetical protein